MTDDLLTRLEKATGPDRELDALLWAEQDNRDVTWYGDRALAKSRVAPYDECVLGTIDPGEHSRNFDCELYHKPPIPLYTASVDAALTLLPKEYGCRIEISPSHRPMVTLGANGPYEAATLPLAICVANFSLRCRPERTDS